MKKNYQLIGFDMDWTLLDSEKKISEANKEGIRNAVAAGKTVVLSTGRGIGRLTEYFDEMPEIQYAVCNNGSVIYDAVNKKKLHHEVMETETVLNLLEVGRPISIGSLFVSDQLIQTEDYLKDPRPIEKINFYFSNDWEREAARAVLEKLPVEVVASDTISLECTKKGVTKGTGFKKLCNILNVPIEETIVCGDSDNDSPVLKVAGLAVAMGNADQCVKDIADVIVADCDHAGCREAIDKYLLG